MDDDRVTGALGRVFTGATALLIGFVGGGVLTLATKVAVARLFSAELYGVFSQGMALLFVLVMVSMMGLNVGVSRFIAYHRGEDRERVEAAVPAALAATVPASLVVFGLVFVFAEPIASIGFADPRTATVLRIFAVAGPFMAVNSILISGFRGHQRSRERVVLLDFVIPALQLAGILILVGLGYAFVGATAGFAAAFAVTAVVAAAWYRRQHAVRMRRGVLGELVRFSWPLMVSSVAVQVFLWSPSLLVGVMASSRDVGLLNAALPLGAATKMILSSVTFLFLPVTADLYSRGELGEMRAVYAAATRWVLVASVPVLVFLAVLPGRSITFLFGTEYASAGTALTVMVLGYLVNIGTGPVGDLLIAVGKTWQEMAANVAKLGLFVVVGVALVPSHGFLGAAVAFAAGMVAGNVLRFAACWEYIGMFYTWSFVKPFVAAVPAGLAAVAGAPHLPFPATVAGFCLVYAAGILVLRPLDPVDRDLVERAAARAGVDGEAVNRVVDRLTA